MEAIVVAVVGAVTTIAVALIERSDRRSAPEREGADGRVERPRRRGVRAAVSQVRRWFGALPHPGRELRPWLAALLGFLFGGFGVALYFRQTPDVLVGILLLLPLGLASSAGGAAEETTVAWWYWIFATLAALYALLRAEDANRRPGPKS